MAIVANYDPNTGKVLGFYDTGYHKVIPAPTVEITAEERSAMLANTVFRIDLGTMRPVTAKAARKDEVDNLLAQKLADGMVEEDYRVQCRPSDLTNMSGAIQFAQMCIVSQSGWPEGFGWRTRNDVLLPLATPEEMVALGIRAFQFVYGKRTVAWAKKDAIDALGSLAAVAAYDVAGGW